MLKPSSAAREMVIAAVLSHCKLLFRRLEASNGPTCWLLASGMWCLLPAVKCSTCLGCELPEQ